MATFEQKNINLMIQPTPYTAMILVRREPFYEWLRQANELSFTTEDNFFYGDHTTYLVPGLERDCERETYLEEHYREIFENELSQWHPRELWPPSLTPDLFNQFFEVQVHREVFING